MQALIDKNCVKVMTIKLELLLDLPINFIIGHTIKFINI